MPVRFYESYNGYWVSTADRKVRRFLWDNTMIAGSHFDVFVAQTMGAGRGTVEGRVTFDGLASGAEVAGVWMYDRERWFWRMTFRDAEGKQYVFITFKTPRGPLPLDTYRTSAFGVVYDDKGVVGYVRWRITLKEVSRLYKTIRPFENEWANRLYRMGLMYPTIMGLGTFFAAVTGPIELARAIFNYGVTFYGGELSSDLAPVDPIAPWPHEIELSNEAIVPLETSWERPI